MSYVSSAPNNFRNPLAQSIFQSKYAIAPEETWRQRCEAVVDDVCGTAGGTMHPLMSKEDRRDLVHFMHHFIFMPGGRYIYYGGRGVKFYNNCYLFRSQEDTREEWGRLLHAVSDALMSGGGVGNDYSVFRPKGSLLKRTGGTASGPIPLAISVNEHGRNVMQGGSRRSAIYASLNWQHGDAHDWLYVKDWANTKIPGTNTTYAEAKAANFDAHAPLDFTNISLNYDNAWLSNLVSGIEFDDIPDDLEDLVADADVWGEIVKGTSLPDTYFRNIEMAMRNGEPGFSFNFFDKESETARNACVTGDTLVLTDQGHLPIAELLGQTVNVWNGEEWSSVTPFATGDKPLYEVVLTDGRRLTCSDNHEFVLKDERRVKACDLRGGETLIDWAPPERVEGEDEAATAYSYDRPPAYSQGFYSAEGNKYRSWSWVYEPKFVCLPRLAGKVMDTGFSGRKHWAHGPMFGKEFVPHDAPVSYRVEWLAGLFDGDGTVVKNKNSIGLQLASTNEEFLLEVQLMLQTLGGRSKVTPMRPAGRAMMPDGRGGQKPYPQQPIWRIHLGPHAVNALVKLGFKTSRLDISNNNPQRKALKLVRVDSVTPLGRTEATYCLTEPKRHMAVFNGVLTGQCTEVVSSDDSDVCNLGSVNMAACPDYETFKRAVELGSKFLVCGTIRGDLPNAAIHRVREKNRRLGLGLMGVHEWLLQRGYRYEFNDELHKWMATYQYESERAANEHCDRFFLNHPVAYRAIAPTGTIGTMAGTTTGLEPIYAVAIKRRYIEGNRETGVESRKFQYSIDAMAQSMIDEYGLDPDTIESASSLAQDPERRIAFQADMQDYVDMAISSTLNLPAWDTEHNNVELVGDFARIVAKYAPRLRGLTFYPDGSRGGQPLVAVPYEEARAALGVVFEENSEKACVSGVCGI